VSWEESRVELPSGRTRASAKKDQARGKRGTNDNRGSRKKEINSCLETGH